MMRKSCIMLLLLFSMLSAWGQDNSENKREFEMKEGDTTYVMKKYFFCMLIAGKNREQSKEEVQAIQKAHMAHIRSLGESGKLAVAGPFEGPTDWRGILIFDVDSKEEAEKLVKRDPAVIAGRLKYEIHPWWTSKGATLK